MVRGLKIGTDMAATKAGWWRLRVWAVALCCMLLLVSALSPTHAQVPDYGKLLGLGQSEDSTPQRSTPAQSSPASGSSGSGERTIPVRQGLGQSTPARGPTIDDYGLVADTEADPLIRLLDPGVEVG
ncbi:MAG: hypothetical protein AAGA55_12940, partial [Planctomycetota bacterium]